MGKMPNYQTVDDYINSQSKEAQLLLHELRSIIIDTVPASMEIPNSKVPSFTLVPGTKPEVQIMMAAYTKHVSLYPNQAAIDHFTDELADYDLGKGTIKFPHNKPLPKELIKRMIIFRKEELRSKPS